MDLSVILGMIGALTSISIGDLMEGESRPCCSYYIFNHSYSNVMFAAATSTESHSISAAFKEIKMVFKKLPINHEARIDELVEYAIIITGACMF